MSLHGLSAGDPEMAELARDEINELNSRVNKLTQTLKVLLLPKDPLDEKNIMLEVSHAYVACLNK